MAEARFFHCRSHVTDNLGERSIPSDCVAVHIVIQKPLGYCDIVKRIPSRITKHHVFCSLLEQISDCHQYPDFKLIIEKARKRTRDELLCNTPGSPSTKLLIAATGTDTSAYLCAAVQLGNRSANASTNALVNVLTFMDKAGLLPASYGKELLNGRQQCSTNLGLRRKKTTPWLNADSAYEHGSPRNRCSAFMRSPMKKDIHSKTKMNQVGGYVLIGAGYLSHAPRTSGTMPMRPFSNMYKKLWKIFSGKIDKQEFDEMIATKKESAPGPDGIFQKYLQVCWWIRVLLLVRCIQMCA